MSVYVPVISGHISISFTVSLTCSLFILTQLIRADVMGEHRGFADSVIHVLAVSSGT